MFSSFGGPPGKLGGGKRPPRTPPNGAPGNERLWVDMSRNGRPICWDCRYLPNNKHHFSYFTLNKLHIWFFLRILLIFDFLCLIEVMFHNVSVCGETVCLSLSACPNTTRSVVLLVTCFIF